jgi:hypothetical protein
MKRFTLAVVAAVLLGVFTTAPMIWADGRWVVNAAEVEKDEKGGVVAVAEGDYTAEGTAGGGTQKYKGTVRIKKKGETYLIQWRIGPSVYSGIGFVDGDRFCVSCVMGGQPCVVVYKIEKDKTLRGRWAIEPGVVDIEVLTYSQPVV